MLFSLVAVGGEGPPDPSPFRGVQQIVRGGGGWLAVGLGLTAPGPWPCPNTKLRGSVSVRHTLRCLCPVPPHLCPVPPTPLPRPPHTSAPSPPHLCPVPPTPLPRPPTPLPRPPHASAPQVTNLQTLWILHPVLPRLYGNVFVGLASVFTFQWPVVLVRCFFHDFGPISHFYTTLCLPIIGLPVGLGVCAKRYISVYLARAPSRRRGAYSPALQEQPSGEPSGDGQAPVSPTGRSRNSQHLAIAGVCQSGYHGCHLLVRPVVVVVLVVVVVVVVVVYCGGGRGGVLWWWFWLCCAVTEFLAAILDQW